MKTYFKTTITALLASSILLFSQSTNAQDVQKKNQLYKKRIVRAIDLREKQNKPLYATNTEFTKLLIEAIKNNEIKAYANDSLTTIISSDEVSQKLKIEGDFVDTNDMDEFELQEYLSQSTDYYFSSRDLYQIELTQDWIFDNHRSSVTKNNIGITIYLPADHPDNIRGIQLPIATVSFDDCTKLWRNNPKATWFNTYNDAAHLNLSEAFKLELYASYIVKVSNADNSYISDDFADKHSIMESLNQQAKLMEYESNVWEN